MHSISFQFFVSMSSQRRAFLIIWAVNFFPLKRIAEMIKIQQTNTVPPTILSVNKYLVILRHCIRLIPLFINAYCTITILFLLLLLIRGYFYKDFSFASSIRFPSYRLYDSNNNITMKAIFIIIFVPTRFTQSSLISIHLLLCISLYRILAKHLLYVHSLDKHQQMHIVVYRDSDNDQLKHCQPIMLTHDKAFIHLSNFSFSHRIFIYKQIFFIEINDCVIKASIKRE